MKVKVDIAPETVAYLRAADMKARVMYRLIGEGGSCCIAIRDTHSNRIVYINPGTNTVYIGYLGAQENQTSKFEPLPPGTTITLEQD